MNSTYIDAQTSDGFLPIWQDLQSVIIYVSKEMKIHHEYKEARRLIIK